ncbi:MAG TPA: VCBS repeat-containing protein [Candidatus Sulfotelmatobacter sp.]|nr:VCBS repeat-containing protein [Candidatus Sulfotelmatobacter sp.]
MLHIREFLLTLILGLALSVRGAAQTDLYNFTGPEIYPIDDSICLLHAADLTGDGLNDLIVADNEHYRIALLYNQTGKTNWAKAVPAASPLQGVNQLPFGARFRLDSIPVDEQISALAVTDLNGDGRPDVVFYGDGKDLEIIYNLGTNGWSEPERWHLDDGQMNPSALAVGDLTGDHRPDIVLLGDNGSLYLLRQRADRTFDEPEKIPYSGTPKVVQIVDVNGDGRNDLMMVDWDSPTPFRIRLQNDAGQLGPEIYFKSQPVHAYSADTLEGNSRQFIATIAENSDRAEVSEFTQRPGRVLSGTLRQGQFQVLPLLKTSAAHRGELWTDLTGNGRPDLLVSDPDSGQISIYLQEADGSLGPPETFSTLTGVSQIAEANWHGGRRPEIFLLSQSEQAVGMTELTRDGRFPFPTLLPIDGTPLIMAVGPLRQGGKPVLCVIVDKDGQRYLVTCDDKGKMRTQKLSDSFTETPVAMTIQDVNRDGLPDVVILVPYDKIKVLLQKPDGSFDEEDVPYPGGGIDQPWMTSMELDGKPELLLPGKNFVRAVVLEKTMETLSFTNRPQWIFRVTDQINGVAGDSQIAGATAVQTGHDGPPTIFLLDAQYDQLTMCQRGKTGVWQVVQNVPLPISDFDGLQTVSLGAPPKHDVQSVAFLGQDALAWMPLAGMVWDFSPLAGYDTPVKDGYLDDVETGDLEGDGRKELVFLETTQHYLDIVDFNSRKLAPAIRWQVFEEHTFRNDSDNSAEPREALVANVTGHRDKKKDLIVVVHDRILLYPQE